jgi:hypothetical protein
MSVYTQFELDILYEAFYALRYRCNSLQRLSEYVKENEGPGLEGWFLGEFILNPFTGRWKIRKKHIPYDLKITDKSEKLKVELKAVTGSDFKTRVLEWFFKTKKVEDRKDVLLLFLSLTASYNKASIDPEVYHEPQTMYVNDDWLVGIIKRK